MAINRSKEWWIARARSEGDMPVGAGVPDAQPTEDALVKHMVDRFLSWQLPEAFHPDGGISFKATFNEHTAHPMKAEPTGTNLFDADQATAMVRHMLDGSDPTPAAAEARATKATEAELLEFLSQRYVLRAEDRQAAMGLSYLSAEVHELAKSLAQFLATSIPPPEPKDGAAPSQSPGADLPGGTADASTEAISGRRGGAATPATPANLGAAPSPETPMGRIHREQLARPRLTPDPDMVWRNPAPDASPPGAPTEGYRRISTADLAPAAPSPDLAALEELAGRLEHVGMSVWSDVCIDATNAKRFAAVIRSILKAQPNAGTDGI